jgi:coenzyme F420 biosynthesis associated uncharacterized protein
VDVGETDQRDKDEEIDQGTHEGNHVTNDPTTPDTHGRARTYVDWEFAKTTGKRLVPAGPAVSPDEAADTVAAIRAAADAAQSPVAETARMHAPGEAPAPVVVDRPTWIDANVDSMAALVDPVFATILSQPTRHSQSGQAGPGFGSSIGGKVTGAEAGGLLAFMASKVLGQYDLAPGGTPKLMLVAPNLVHVQRELAVDPHDFRLWVCMHEETHRVQFTANAWLRDHLIEGAQTLATELTPDPRELAERLEQVVRQIPDAISRGGQGIIDVFTTPEQRERLAALTAVMSLLEGHADVVMDEVGPSVVPSVAEIRRKFNQRRRSAGAVDRMLRRLLGLEAKMRQYRDGAVFVRAVVDEVGVEKFNAIWTSPETLPRAEEIPDPAAWVRRVHG